METELDQLNQGEMADNKIITSPEQWDDRMLKCRERNREHAKKTRLRKKVGLDGMKQRLLELQNEASQLQQKLEETNTANILLNLSGFPPASFEASFATPMVSLSSQNTSASLWNKGNIIDYLRSSIRAETATKSHNLFQEYSGFRTSPRLTSNSSGSVTDSRPGEDFTTLASTDETEMKSRSGSFDLTAPLMRHDHTYRHHDNELTHENESDDELHDDHMHDDDVESFHSGHTDTGGIGYGDLYGDGGEAETTSASPLNSGSTSSSKFADPKTSLEDCATLRKERNRIHAKLTRDRKKLFTARMQQLISTLERQNALLRHRLLHSYSDKGSISYNQNSNKCTGKNCSNVTFEQDSFKDNTCSETSQSSSTSLASSSSSQGINIGQAIEHSYYQSRYGYAILSSPGNAGKNIIGNDRGTTNMFTPSSVSVPQHSFNLKIR